MINDLAQFMSAMSGISRPNFVALAERFDFGPYRTLCDVGGAAAELSCAVAAKHPHIEWTMRSPRMLLLS